MMAMIYDESYHRLLQLVCSLPISKKVYHWGHEEMAEKLMPALAEAYDRGVRENSARTARILCNKPTDQLINPYKRTTNV